MANRARAAKVKSLCFIWFSLSISGVRRIAAHSSESQGAQKLRKVGQFFCVVSPRFLAAKAATLARFPQSCMLHQWRLPFLWVITASELSKDRTFVDTSRVVREMRPSLRRHIE
jgi:hypothetical protein